MEADPNCSTCQGTGFAPTAMMGVTTPCECVRGATGRYPDGKFHEGDKGELRIELSASGGLVHLDFGKDICWIAMRPQDARDLAQKLIDKADTLESVS